MHTPAAFPSLVRVVREDGLVPEAIPTQVVNRLILGMPRKARERMLAQSELVDLKFGDVLCEADAAYTEVYFPLTGFISLVATVSDRPPLEMGLIGNEGMLGATIALGVAAAPLRAIVQGPGSAWCMNVATLQEALADDPTLSQLLDRYLFVLTAQLAQTVACTRFHEIEARLARWLLMTHDRAHADHFHLTHQFLANMLGVQRGAVTLAAGALQRRGLIRYARGEINVVARVGLEAAACECYAAVRQDYDQRLS
jgi:CRP-like cAMP-binding protein